MSAANDGGRSAPSPNLRASNTPNRTFTPCRTVGLKRKSAGTPSLHGNVPKRTKAVVVVEAKKRIGFDGDGATLAAQAGDESIPKSDGDDVETVRRNVAKKRLEINTLKSELRNSEQHNLSQIQELSNKWLNVCQEALTALYDQLNKNQNCTLHSMEDLIKNLGIDPDLIHFDCSTEEFN